MDSILCDELLQEIFRRLPPPSSAAVSLVCKRWLYLLRSSTTSLSLTFYVSPLIPTLSSFLLYYPYLSTLSITSVTTLNSSDRLLFSVFSSCPNLLHIKFLAGPVSSFSLFSLSASCPKLVSLAVTLFRPLSFSWLTPFRSLKQLSIYSTGDSRELTELNSVDFSGSSDSDQLNLESLLLTGIQSGDKGIGFLWRNCKKVKTLKLKSCEGVGDQASFFEFLECLEGLQHVELRTCRTIADGVLLKLGENCDMLNSLLLYDGGNKEGLLHFLSQSKCYNLQKLDLRLPLDLDNDHLTAAAENLGSLRSLRLQSCCLVTGEGLKVLGNALGNGLEELALVNCDVVERESGLLSTLGQQLKKLRKLDLSFNDMLIDKELISMVVSCNKLSELKLRGCNKLTNLAMVSLAKCCKNLETVDVMYCYGIEALSVELFVLNSPKLRRLQIEENKVSGVARTWASNKFIELVEGDRWSRV